MNVRVCEIFCVFIRVRVDMYVGERERERERERGDRKGVFKGVCGWGAVYQEIYLGFIYMLDLLTIFRRGFYHLVYLSTEC